MRALTSCFRTISLEIFKLPAISPNVLSPLPSSPYLCLITKLSLGFKESSWRNFSKKLSFRFWFNVITMHRKKEDDNNNSKNCFYNLAEKEKKNYFYKQPYQQDYKAFRIWQNTIAIYQLCQFSDYNYDKLITVTTSTKSEKYQETIKAQIW